jgi:hypothetical protein
MASATAAKKHSPKLLKRSMMNLTRRSRAGELPDAVEELYGIDKATPQEKPTFVFMVGSPGAGKSQGHKALLENGVFPDYNYAIINLDFLLESLVPFRIASSFAHSLRRCLGEDYPKTGKKFSSLSCYGSRASDAGAFAYFDHSETRDELMKALAAKLAATKGLSPEAATSYVVDLFENIGRLAARDRSVAAIESSLMELNAEAIHAAIRKRVNIVYETTFSSIKKFNDLYQTLIDAGYYIIVYHIVDKKENIRAKLHARQEHEMPFEEFPFYRFVLASDEAVSEYIGKTAAVVKEIRGKVESGAYDGDRVFVDEYKVKFDPARLASEPDFNFEAQIERLKHAYNREGEIRRTGGRRRQGTRKGAKRR